MQAAPTYRWGLGFIAMRWRHLFWLLPLAGFLLGLALQLHALYGPTATGLIQVRQIAGSSPLTFMKDAADALQSDEVLLRALAPLGFEGQWKDKQEARVSKLRKMIRSEQIPGTSLLEVRVSASDRAESIAIWNALTLSLNEHFVDQRSAADEAKLDTLRAKIEARERDLAEQRKNLSAALERDDLVLREPGSPADQKHKAESAQLKADFEASQKALEKAKMDLISREMGCRFMENPIISHEEPGISLPWTHREVLSVLLHRAGIGLSIGVLLTAPLAYLLELLFPRRHTQQD